MIWSGADALLPQMAADRVIADKAFDADQRVIIPLPLRHSRESGHRALAPCSGQSLPLA